jgi:L-aspartate oxidase
MRHLDPQIVPERFSTLAAQLAEWGLDMSRDPIPVAPAAHYCMGGVRTDDMGRSDVPGLYVAGEAACTGAQGANRLASNSLLECLVFGRLAAQAALEDGPAASASWQAERLPVPEGVALRDANVPMRTDSAASSAGADLERYLGVERDRAGLQMLIRLLEDSTHGSTTVAALSARSALLRQESRGAHYRTDYPEMDSSWQGRILWQRGREPRFERIQ